MKHYKSISLVILICFVFGCSSKSFLLQGNVNDSELLSFERPIKSKTSQLQNQIKTFEHGVYAIFFCESTEDFTGRKRKSTKKFTENRRKFGVCTNCSLQPLNSMMSTIDSGKTFQHTQFSKQMENIFRIDSVPLYKYKEENIIEVMSLIFIDDERVIMHHTNNRWSEFINKNPENNESELKSKYEKPNMNENSWSDRKKENKMEKYQDRLGSFEKLDFEDDHDKAWINSNARRGYYTVLKDSIEMVFETMKGKQFKLFGKIDTVGNEQVITALRMTSDKLNILKDEKGTEITSLFGINGDFNFTFKKYNEEAPPVQLNFEGTIIKGIERDHQKSKTFLYSDTVRTILHEMELYEPW